MTDPWRVVSLMPLPAGGAAGLLASFGEAITLRSLPDPMAVPSRDELARTLDGAEVVLASWQGTRPLPFDRFAIEACGPSLAFVQQPSVGVDSLDVETLTAAGVPLANTAGANATAVAQWCLAAALHLTRLLGWADAEVRAGRWPQTSITAAGSVELGALPVGIVGFGAIGRECARLFGALGSPVSYWSRTEKATDLATFRPLDELVATSRVLVVVLPRTPETTGLIDPGRLPAGAFLVDAGRGGVVDGDRLRAALAAGHLGGAALDVHVTEPIPADDPLRTYDRVLLSPHAAGSTQQSILSIIGVAVENLRRAVAGEPVVNVVNGLDPLVRRRP